MIMLAPGGRDRSDFSGRARRKNFTGLLHFPRAALTMVAVSSPPGADGHGSLE
jgi:hypothetical protein